MYIKNMLILMTDCGILVYLILSLRFSMLWITLLVRYEAPNALTFCLLVFKKIRQYCETKSKRKRNVTATGTYHGMQLCTSQVFFFVTITWQISLGNCSPFLWENFKKHTDANILLILPIRFCNYKLSPAPPQEVGSVSPNLTENGTRADYGK